MLANATGFTVSVTSWMMSDGAIQVGEDPPEEKYILIEYPLSSKPNEKHVHAVPLSALAFRMEILGVPTETDALELVIKEMNGPEVPGSTSVYPQALKTYYRSSSEFARLLAEEVQAGALPFFARSTQDVASEFLSQVRSLLRDDPADSAMRSAARTPVGDVASALRGMRSSARASLQAAASAVSIEETASWGDLRSAVAGFAPEVSVLADVQAMRAMETGAMYYAQQVARSMGARG